MNAADISNELARRVNDLARDLLPEGRRAGHEWRCGSVSGESGDSLGVHLSGSRAGIWSDFATGEGGDALDLVRAVHGFDTSVALAWSRRWLGISEDGRRPRYPAKPSPQKAAEPDAEAKQARALDIWANAVPVDGTSAEHYLRSRGLDPEKLYSLTGPRSWPATLRYSERVALNPGQLCRALIIAVHCGHLGSVRSIQRVLLNRDGTAVRDSRGRRMKLSLGPIRGNAAMFDYWPDSEGRWGLAEGPETALAAYSLTGIPTWAAIAAGNMHQVVPPSWARHAVIFSDNDNVGMAAAAKALQAIQSRPGIESVRIAATTSGNDAADLNSRAH